MVRFPLTGGVGVPHGILPTSGRIRNTEAVVGLLLAVGVVVGIGPSWELRGIHTVGICYVVGRNAALVGDVLGHVAVGMVQKVVDLTAPFVDVAHPGPVWRPVPVIGSSAARDCCGAIAIGTPTRRRDGVAHDGQLDLM